MWLVFEASRRNGRYTMLSPRSDLPTKLRGFGLGAADYLSKPFSFDELIARIHVQLRRAKQGEDGHLVRAGTLVLDIARREARLGPVTAQLSDREFRVLHHLAVHHGEVISRERLLSEVWGYHFDPGSNVVDVNVARLRKKLENAKANIGITAKRGLGFVLDVSGSAGSPATS